MQARLFVVHGSHPCAAIEKDLELKGVPYKVFEWTPPTHAIGQRLIFGARTVPGIRFDDGERVLGSRAIMSELDRRVPEPLLYPDDQVREADRWGEQVFQPVARRIIWPAFAKDPVALHSFQQGSRLPALPLPVIKALAPGIARIERRMNGASDDAMRDDLAALPEHLNRIDAWIAGGGLEGDGLNAAGPADRRHVEPAAGGRGPPAADRAASGGPARASDLRADCGARAGGADPGRGAARDAGGR